MSIRLVDRLPFKLASQALPAKLECSIMQPKGDGVNDVQFVLEGPFLNQLDQWYDTFDGIVDASPDWYALHFSQKTTINTIFFMHGPMFSDGGWWTTLEVQYTDQDGRWQTIPAIQISPTYDFRNQRGNRRPYEAYQIGFPTVETHSVRLLGEPGGLVRVTTLAYLSAGLVHDGQGQEYLRHLNVPQPELLRLFPADKLWELIESLRKVTGIAFDLQTKEGLGLDHFLDEEQYRQFHTYNPELNDPESLYQLLGNSEGWDTFGQRAIEARQAAYESRQAEIRMHHGGMAWFAIPVIIKGEVLGTIENRNLFSIDGPDNNWHADTILAHDIDLELYFEALKRVPVFSRARATQTIQLLQIIIRLFEEQLLRIEEIARLKGKAERANDAKSEFVSLVSHELKNPMTTIKGYTNLLVTGLPGPVNETQVEFLSNIQSGVAQMERLVGELSDVTQIETGHLRLDLATVILPEVIGEVASSFKVEIKEKEQQLGLEIEEDLPAVQVDPDRLRQILNNLISNAVKYSPEKSRIILAARLWAEAPDQAVHISVQDDGLGIKVEEQEKIFDKFFRSEDAAAWEQPGTGLGLNITKRLVEMHGGRIWFESTFREGTTFHLTLPIPRL